MAISAATAATITAVVAVASAATTAYVTMQQANQQEKQANAQARAMEQQAQMQQLNARSAAAEHQNNAARIAASQVASGAGAGVSLESGSLLDIMADTANKYELDRQQIIRTGNINAAASSYSADMMRMSGKAAKANAWPMAGATLLNGISTGMSYGEKGGWFD